MGEDKASIRIAGQPLLERVVTRLSALFEEVLVVGRVIPQSGERSILEQPGIRSVPDRVPGKGPLGGIVTALEEVRGPACLVVACDMPFLSTRLLAWMVGLCRDVDVVVPRDDRGHHPLHAIYARTLLPLLSARLAAGRLGMQDLFERVRCRVVAPGEVALLAPGPDPLTNVNTPAELERAVQEAEGREPGPGG